MAALVSQNGSEQDPAARVDVHVPAYEGGRCRISAGVNLGRRSPMLQQHESDPFN